MSVADLAPRHAPVSDLFAEQLAGDPARFRLTDDQLAFYRENGYVSGVRILTDAQCDALLGQLAGLMDPASPGHDLFHEYHSNESTDPNRVLFHALGAWRVAPGFHDLLWNPAFTVPASQLLEGSVRFWHDQLFCKPARHGGVVAWHQDYSYWTRTKPLGHLTCWIGLDDARADNGCLHYVPGSHTWELLPITGLAGDMDAIRQALTPDQFARLERSTPIELKRGEATFHHPLLIHGSFANDTERPRRATVLNVFRDGTRSDSDEPLLAGVPVVPKGAVMGGDFFPLLRANGSTATVSA